MFTVSDVVSVVESDLISGALACPASSAPGEVRLLSFDACVVAGVVGGAAD